jgi:hypothetical protein
MKTLDGTKAKFIKGHLYSLTKADDFSIWPVPRTRGSFTAQFKAKKTLFRGDVLIYLGLVKEGVDMTDPDEKLQKHHAFLTRFGIYGRNVMSSIELYLEDVTPEESSVL